MKVCNFLTNYVPQKHCWETLADVITGRFSKRLWQPLAVSVETIKCPNHIETWGGNSAFSFLCLEIKKKGWLRLRGTVTFLLVSMGLFKFVLFPVHCFKILLSSYGMEMTIDNSDFTVILSRQNYIHCYFA